MPTSGSLNPNSDTFANWGVSGQTSIWQTLADGNGSTYTFTTAASYCEVGLEDPVVTAGYGVGSVSLGVAWNSDAGVTTHLELWLGSTLLASAASSLTYTFPTPISGTAASDLRMRLVADSVPGGLYARANAASGSWTGVDATPPAAPTGLAATAGWSHVDLAWNANTETDLAGYKLYRKIGAGAYGTPIYTGPARTYTDAGLTDGTLYTYKLTAYDGAGNESVASSEASATPTTPLAPSGLTVTPGSSLLRIRWDVSPAEIAGYKLYRKIGAGAYGTPIYTGTATSYVDSPLTPGTTYTYKVSVYDSDGHESATSADASGVPDTDRAADTYSGGTAPILPTMSTRWIQLADPLQKVQIHRIIPSFYWAGTNCPLQISVTQSDGSFVLPWTTLPTPATDGNVHRPVIECFAEADAIQVSYRVAPGSTVPFVKLELYDTAIEYQDARQRQP